MHPRLAEIAAFLDETRAAVLRAVTPLSAEDAACRPGPEAWSVDEILTHLSLVEPGVAKRIAKSVGKAKGEGLERETSVASVLGSLGGPALDKLNEKQVAPEFVEPKAVLSKPEALAALALSRESLRHAMAEADGWALEKVVAPHPRLGTLDMYQWLVFVGHHERRHLA
ncbi:MAG: DinB family protein, partial [Thermoanaerobaculia bacterium]